MIRSIQPPGEEPAIARAWAVGVKTEDDQAEIVVSVAAVPRLHEIPTLSSVGISVMVVLLVGLGVLFLRRGAARRATQA